MAWWSRGGRRDRELALIERLAGEALRQARDAAKARDALAERLAEMSLRFQDEELERLRLRNDAERNDLLAGGVPLRARAEPMVVDDRVDDAPEVMVRGFHATGGGELDL